MLLPAESFQTCRFSLAAIYALAFMALLRRCYSTLLYSALLVLSLLRFTSSLFTSSPLPAFALSYL